MNDQKSWCYPTELSKQEERICVRLKRNGKLFVFLRQNRHLIFTTEVHQKLLSMYSDYPRGKPIVCPMLLAMVSLLQAYEQESDASAVLESMFDQRWQMVLGCLGTEHPVFSQGVLCDFRHRLIKYNMDVMLLEQTVAVAKEVGGFCYKQLRIALDSAPLEGAGRVEDTFNLIGHALELLVDCAAQIKQTNESEIIQEAGTRFIGKYSIKAALDIDWSDIQEKNKAINILLQDVEAIRQWLGKQPASFIENQYLKEALSLLETVLSQNIEPDPDGGSKIIDGVSPDRRISITDSDMRHGRISSSRTINGFKQHIAKVEHALASICNRKGPRARYVGLRLNEYDLNRTAMITNLHVALSLAA